jgi:hypothetical protein
MDSRDEERRQLEEDFMDFTIIGAAHLADGVTDYREWSRVMLKDVGSSLRPLFPALYQQSKSMLARMSSTLDKNTKADGDSPARDSQVSAPELARLKKEIAAAEAQMDLLLEQLSASGSAVKREFAARYKRYRIERPDYFLNPDWVEKLQQECMDDFPA